MSSIISSEKIKNPTDGVFILIYPVQHEQLVTKLQMNHILGF